MRDHWVLVRMLGSRNLEMLRQRFMGNKEAIAIIEIRKDDFDLLHDTGSSAGQ